MSKPSPLAPLVFLSQTLLLQITTAALAVLMWTIAPSIILCAIASIAAPLIASSYLQLPPPWRIMNALIPLATMTTMSIQVPSWLFLIPLLALACVYAPAFWTRVPYYPTSRETYPLILAELPLDKPFTFIDIGCGVGDLLIFLQRHRPQGVFYGTEIGVLPFLISRFKALWSGTDRVTIYFRDLHCLDLSTFDYAYAFLSPAVMERVWTKVRKELPPSSTFITNSFQVPAEATHTVSVKDKRRSMLFVHKMHQLTMERQRSC